MQEFRQLFEGDEAPRRSSETCHELCKTFMIGLLRAICGSE